MWILTATKSPAPYVGPKYPNHMGATGAKMGETYGDLYCKRNRV